MEKEYNEKYTKRPVVSANSLQHALIPSSIRRLFINSGFFLVTEMFDITEGGAYMLVVSYGKPADPPEDSDKLLCLEINLEYVVIRVKRKEEWDDSGPAINEFLDSLNREVEGLIASAKLFFISKHNVNIEHNMKVRGNFEIN